MKLLSTFNQIIAHHNRTGRLPLSSLHEMKRDVDKKMSTLAFSGPEGKETTAALAKLASRMTVTELVGQAVYSSEQARDRFRKLLRALDQEAGEV